MDACPFEVSDPASLELALWFHDAIYDTSRSDNEAKSAAWARHALTTLSRSQLDRIEQLILLTKHDTLPVGLDQELILDLDLSILGASPARFDVYEAQIRQEFSWIPDAVYKRDRAKILTAFLSRWVIYHTTYFRDMLEVQARENLERSLSALWK
jgi:predicted metal-dependent HD superfamily phosphohydrolase